jgi:hypothetical protein
MRHLRLRPYVLTPRCARSSTHRNPDCLETREVDSLLSYPESLTDESGQDGLRDWARCIHPLTKWTKHKLCPVNLTTNNRSFDREHYELFTERCRTFSERERGEQIVRGDCHGDSPVLYRPTHLCTLRGRNTRCERAGMVAAARTATGNPSRRQTHSHSPRRGSCKRSVLEPETMTNEEIGVRRVRDSHWTHPPPAKQEGLEHTPLPLRPARCSSGLPLP